MFDIEALRERQETHKEFLLQRFGDSKPELKSECVRCHQDYGQHYDGGTFLYCPDEWVAEGHSLSI